MAAESKFVTVLNRNGEKQRIPREWVAEGHVFADQFTHTPQQRQMAQRSETPDATWTVAQLRGHAEKVGVDLTGITTKADIVSAINAPVSGEEEN